MDLTCDATYTRMLCYSKWIEGGRCDEGYKDGKEL